MLSPECAAELAALPESEAARRLLLGETGPLMAVAPFEAGPAALGYLIHMAYRRARRQGGMLARATKWDARATLRGRVYAAASRSRDAQGFARELYAGLGDDVSTMQVADLLWWRRQLAVHGSESTWWDLSDDASLSEAVTAAELLDSLLYLVHQERKNAAQ